MVGGLVGGKDPKREVLVAAVLKLARGAHADAVAAQQHAEQELGVVGRDGRARRCGGLDRTARGRAGRPPAWLPSRTAVRSGRRPTANLYRPHTCVMAGMSRPG